MKQPSNVKDLIALWPTRDAMRAAMEPHMEGEITTGRINKWAWLESIPAKYHKSVILAAQDCGLNVSAETLVDLHAPRPNPEAAQ